jgi:hypothetical protein
MWGVHFKIKLEAQRLRSKLLILEVILKPQMGWNSNNNKSWSRGHDTHTTIATYQSLTSSLGLGLELKVQTLQVTLELQFG